MGSPRRKPTAESPTSSAKDPPPAMVSVKELSRYLQVSRNTILRMVESGQIPVTRVGKLLRFDVLAVRAVLDRNT